jgi:predicted N-acetyltransferase YhbS
MLDLLCTDPQYERKGHGKALVNWGIEEAKKEGICNSVIAAHERDGFYAQFGFKEVGRANVGPLAGLVKGGTVMFR